MPVSAITKCSGIFEGRLARRTSCMFVVAAAATCVSSVFLLRGHCLERMAPILGANAASSASFYEPMHVSAPTRFVMAGAWHKFVHAH